MSHQLIDIRKTIPKHKTKKWRSRTRKIDTIVIHTTASNNQNPNKTAYYHSTPSNNNHLCKTGAPGIAYHDFVTKDGTIYHCNDYMDITWHTRGWNHRGVGIALAFKGQTGEAPSELMRIALEKHLVVLCLYMKVLPKRIKGHREGPGMAYQILGKGPIKYKKSCPGFGVNLKKLRENVTKRLQRRLAAEKLYYGKIDGLFGYKSQRALKLFKPKVNKDVI